jgi:hypothetical protein
MYLKSSVFVRRLGFVTPWVDKKEERQAALGSQFIGSYRVALVLAAGPNV